MSPANPGERFDLPNGTAVYYVDEDHSYWRCKPDGSRGKRLTGVTTPVKTLDWDPERLLSWAAKTQCIGIAELAGAVVLGEIDTQELSWLASHETIWKALQEAELTFEHVRDRAATRGTNVHKLALQALAMGRSVPDFAAMTEEERGYANGIVAFWLDHDPKVLQTEQVVYSEDLGVAGRMDLRAELSMCHRGWCPCRRGGISVTDAKTGRFISAAAHAQIGGYRKLSEVSGFGPSDWGGFIKVYEDGSYELIESEGTPEDFEAALDVYRRAARINREAGKTRKASREAIAQQEAMPV